MKKERRNVFPFTVFHKNEKRMKALKIQIKNLLNIKIVFNSSNFVFHIPVKTKSKYKTLNFPFLTKHLWLLVVFQIYQKH